MRGRQPVTSPSTPRASSPTSRLMKARSAPCSLRRLSAAWAGPGDHAAKLPAVAGHAVRRAGADGGQRRPAQACFERAADRAVPAGPSPGPGPGRHLPDLVVGKPGRGHPARPPSCGRDADRIKAGRVVGGGHRREQDQEGRTRAGRQRPVHRHALGRLEQGGPGGRDGAVREQRHSRASRPSASSSTMPSTTNPSGYSSGRCRPRPSATRWPQARRSVRWPPSSSVMTSRTWWPTRRPRDPCCRAAAWCRTGPASTTRRRSWPASPGDARLPRGGLRAGRDPVPGP